MQFQGLLHWIEAVDACRDVSGGELFHFGSE